jgi:hypothetical protein
MFFVWPAVVHGTATAAVESIWAVFFLIYLAVLVAIRKSKHPG